MVLLEVLFFKFLLLKVIETEKIYIYIGKPLRMGKDYSLAIPNRDWKIFENWTIGTPWFGLHSPINDVNKLDPLSISQSNTFKAQS